MAIGSLPSAGRRALRVDGAGVEAHQLLAQEEGARPLPRERNLRTGEGGEGAGVAPGTASNAT